MRLSVIIPAYNEARRLPPFLADLRRYCDGQFQSDYEVIVVDDGSTDGMHEVLEEWVGRWGQLSLIRHLENRGKGAAVRTGLGAAAGGLLLVADADGSAPIEEESKLRGAIRDGADVAVGSRLLKGDPAGARRGVVRAVTGLAFAWVVRRLFGLSVRDTQCGFKLFRRAVAHRVLPACLEIGYLIDVELLAWAHKLGYQVVEVPITWREVSGSKVRLVRDGVKMLRGLLRLRKTCSRRLETTGCPDRVIEVGAAKQLLS
jgi:dolichyl-phosphate beta-glucosyltransferase